MVCYRNIFCLLLIFFASSVQAKSFSVSTEENMRRVMDHDAMMMAECPDKKQTSRYAASLHTGITIKSIKKKGEETLYNFTEDKTGNAFTLSCINYRVTVVN